MRLITRLKHDAREMTDSVFGWDIFRCMDYDNIDRSVESFSDLQNIKPIFGYTVILALNIKGLKLFNRLFIKTT